MKVVLKALSTVWLNPAYRFLLSFFLLFAIFYSFNIFYIGITSPGRLYVPFLDEHLNYIRWWRKGLLESSAAVIRLFDYDLYTTPIRLQVDGRRGVVLVYSCLGYGIMSVFAAFVLAWPDKPWKSKLLFLAFGLIIIQLLNIARLIGLSLLGRNFPFYHTIDHHTVFNIAVYAVLLVMVYFWLRKIMD